MRIKRYFAPDIKQAIRMVREELGPDAVILSNRKVDGGVEIVAARDFDEQSLMSGEKTDVVQGGAAQAGRTEAKRRTEDTFEAALGAAAFRGVQAESPIRRQNATKGDDLSRFSRSVAESRPERIPPRQPGEPDDEMTASPQSVGRNRDMVRDHYRDSGARRDEEDSSERNRFSGNQFRQRRAEPPPPVSDIQENPVVKNRTRQAPLGQAQSMLESRSQYSGDGQDQFVRVVQQELRMMRNMLDSHLGEAGWQSASERSPLRIDLLKRFSEMGFSRRMTLELAQQVANSRDMDTAIEDAGELLLKMLPLAQEDLLETGGIVALVGPTGVGKTTTIAKLAARFRMKHGPREIALITTDNYRIAAYEQLTTYGRILDVPVRIASGLEELHQHLDTFYDRKLVLIDTAGMGPRDLRLLEQIGLFKKVAIPIKSYLVLSTASQLRTMQEAIDAFEGFSPEACILTKIDEAAQPGSSLSVVIENRLPVAFICDGQQVPEDLHHARKNTILNWCLNVDENQDTDANRPFSYEDWIIHANV